MLRLSCECFGRWSSRDFLRGRSKKAGSVHTRHTHGSKGRYHRLSRSHTVRDGRRHAENRMQGALGIKLGGGGLFGVRTPHAHLLSRLTPEAFDCALHGHPCITNPYRNRCLDEHPALQQVMRNATVDVEAVVLLPRAPRRWTGGAVPAVLPLPEEWLQLARWLLCPSSTTATSSETDATKLPGLTAIHWCTLHHTTTTLLEQQPVSADSSSRDAERDGRGGDGAPASVQTGSHTSSSHHLVDEVVLPALQQLYRQHCEGRVIPLVRQQQPMGHPGKGADLFRFTTSCDFPSVAATAPKTASLFSSSTRQDRLQRAPNAPLRSHQPERQDSTERAGALGLVTQYTTVHPDALRVCQRLLPAMWKKGVDGAKKRMNEKRSTFHESEQRQLPLLAALDPSEDRSGPWAALHRDRQRRLQDLSLSSSSTASVEDQYSHPLCRLVRHHYTTNDPRAHCTDLMPHHVRRLRVLYLVDASSANRDAITMSDNSLKRINSGPQRWEPSLISDAFAASLSSLGFQALEVPPSAPSLRDMLEEMNRSWGVDATWAKVMVAMKGDRESAAGQTQRKEDSVCG